MRFYLNDVLVPAPEGLAGMYLEKTRSTRTWGILRSSIGRVRGQGEIKFTSPLAVQILDSYRQKFKTAASVNFKAVDDNGLKFIDAEINYTNYRRDEIGYSITLRDEGEIEAFDMAIDKVVSIEPNTSMEFRSVPLIPEITHQIDKDLARFAWKVPATTKPMAHYPPFLSVVNASETTGRFQSVSDVSLQQPFYVNSTTETKRIRVQGNVIVGHRSATSTTGKVAVLVQNGTEVASYEAASVSIGSSLEAESYLIDVIVTVAQNAQLFLEVGQFLSNSANFEFTYDSKSFLYVNIESSVPDTTVKGVSALDLLKLAAEKSANITVESAVLNNPFVTNGSQLRAAGSSIKTSFGRVFDDLNKMYNLMLVRKSQDTIAVVRKLDYVGGLGDGLLIDKIQNALFGPDSNSQYSQVIAGYNKWSSYTPLGNTETFGNNTYETALRKVDSPLNLLCYNVVASEKLIEAVRRLQFGVGGSFADADYSNDEQLFVKNAPTIQEIVDNWACIWGCCTDQITKTAGSPDNSAEIINSITPIFTGERAWIDCNISKSEWLTLGDVVTMFWKGQKIRVFVMSASYRPGVAGSGAESNTMIEGLVINDDNNE